MAEDAQPTTPMGQLLKRQSSSMTSPGSPGSARSASRGRGIDLQIVRLRLRFLQMVSLGLLDPEQWEDALSKAVSAPGV